MILITCTIIFGKSDTAIWKEFFHKVFCVMKEKQD